MAYSLGFKPVSKGKRYFLCYARKDTERVGKIARYLNRMGVPMWYDSGLGLGHSWEKQISIQLAGCEAILLFLTSDIFQNCSKSYTIIEIEYGVRIRKPIFPVWLDKIDLDLVAPEDCLLYYRVSEMHGILAFDKTADIIAARMINEIPLFRDKSSENMKLAEINTSKIIILGRAGVGKSFTLARIMNNGKKEDYDTSKTKGIDIKPYIIDRKTDDVNNRNKKGELTSRKELTINFWDFGGQEVYYSMHRCFLTNRTAYLIVVDTRTADLDLTSEARYWLNNIASFAKKSPVLVMINLWEENRSRGIDENSLRTEFEDLLDIRGFISISAKDSSEEEFRYFTEKTVQLARSMDSASMTWPIPWNEVRKELMALGKNHKNYYIDQLQYYEICEDNGIYDRDTQLDLLSWFNDLGECFSYYENDDNNDNGNNIDLEGLSRYKVLDPQWITNAIYILITRGYSYIDERLNPGVIKRRDINSILNKAKGGTVDYIGHYEPEECDYILEIMRKFELSYRISPKSEFIPALLPANKPEKIEPDTYTQRIKYELRYRFLPDTVLQKLMVRCYANLKKEKCWAKGLVLESRMEKLEAVLDMGGDNNILNITVFACGEAPANVMLRWVLGQVGLINNRLSMKSEDYIVIDIEGEEPIKVDKILNWKSKGSTVIQGERYFFNINQLLGLAFGDLIHEIDAKRGAFFVKSTNRDEQREESQEDVGDKESIINLRAENDAHINERVYHDTMRLNMRQVTWIMGEIAKREGIDIQDSNKENDKRVINYNYENCVVVQDSTVGNFNHADRGSSITVQPSEDITALIEQLADYLANDRETLVDAIAKLDETSSQMASDLRDINVELTRAIVNHESNQPAKKKLASFIENAANITTILTALLNVAQNPQILDYVCRIGAFL